MRKKKIEETKISVELPPEEIKIKQEGGNVLFIAGEKTYFIAYNELLPLINSFVKEGGDIRVGDLYPKDSFNDLNTRENVARFMVLSARRKLINREIAEYMGITEKRYQAWIADLNSISFRNKMLRDRPKVTGQLADEYEMEKFPEKKKKEKPVSFDAKKVAKAFFEQGSRNLDGVIKALKVDKATFMSWYQLNMREVNRQYNQLVENQVEQDTAEERYKAQTDPDYFKKNQPHPY